MTQGYALIIDDEPNNVGVLETLLELEGFKSYTVNGGIDWQSQLAKVGQVAVIFLDLLLPRVSGYALLTHLKSDPRFGGVPIIAYSVHLSEIKSTALTGFDGFLGKPVDADLFPEQLAQILRGEKVWFQP